MNNRLNRDCRSGFTFFETVLVIAIIAVVIGVYLSGQALIYSAELRGFTTQAERFRFAQKEFKQQYRFLPGDLNNATNYWGWQGAGGCNRNNPSAVYNPSNGVCDGNGDDRLDSACGGSNCPTEIFQFWRHLQMAGFIDGKYSGMSNTSRFDASVGTDVDKKLIAEGITGPANSPVTPLIPRHRVASATVRGTRSGWSVLTTDYYRLGDASVTGGNAYREPYRKYFYNQFRLGLKNNGNLYVLEFLTPSEMRDIDKKIDDGKPLTGSVVPRFIYGATAADPACTNAPFTTVDGPGGTDGIGNRAYNAQYNTAYQDIACGMLIEMKR